MNSSPQYGNLISPKVKFSGSSLGQITMCKLSFLPFEILVYSLFTLLDDFSIASFLAAGACNFDVVVRLLPLQSLTVVVHLYVAAVSCGNLKLLQYMVVNNLGSVLSLKHCPLLLHLAVSKGQLVIVKFILSATILSPTWTTVDDEGNNLMHLAATYGCVGIIQSLHEYFPESCQDMITETNDAGQTPLFLAVTYNRIEMVEFLVQQYSQYIDFEFCFYTSVFSGSILDYAIECDFDRDSLIVIILIDAGARCCDEEDHNVALAENYYVNYNEDTLID